MYISIGFLIFYAAVAVAIIVDKIKENKKQK